MGASPHLSIRHRVSPNFAAAIVFIIAAALTTIIVWNSEQDRRQIERARISDIAGDYSHTLQHHIERALSVTYSLAALVRQGNGDIPDFEATASELLSFFPGVASLQLAPGGIVQRIVPLAGNENAIGHDLLKDPLRTKEAFLARDTGKLTLAGPFKLVQGGIGAVGRLPVFLEKSNGGSSFWGFTIVLIRFPDVLDNAQLSNLEERGLNYELWRIHPDTGERQAIIASSAVPVKPVDSSLELPNGIWILSVAPAEGWGDAVGLTIRMALALIISMLLAILAGSLLNTRAAALRIAQKLTIDLKKSEQKFRAIYDHTFQFIGLLSVDGTLIEANRTALEFTGKKESEVTGKLFWQTPWWAHSQELQEKLCAAIKKAGLGEFVRFEATHPAFDGSLHYIDFSLKPVKDEAGNVILIIPEGRDITDRRQAEKMLHRLNRQMRAISNCNRTLIQVENEQTLLDSICRIICDEAGYRLAWVGYAEHDDDKTVRPVAMAGFDSGYIANTEFSWDDASEYGQGPVGTVIRSGEIIYIQDIATDPQIALVRDDDLLRGYRSCIAMPLKEQNKKTFGILLIYSDEINAFSKDEIRLLEELSGDLAFGITALRTREALQHSEERLRLEVARMPLGYIVWDQDFRVVTWNPAAEAIFGFTYDEAKGRHPYETIVPPEAQPQVESIWERLLSGDISAHSVNENLTKYKQNIVCEWTNTPLKQSDGTVLGAISMVQDITERKRAEEEIRKLNRELEQRVQERTLELRERNTELNMEIHERKQAMAELHRAKTQLEDANRLLEDLSVTDSLTGLANRRRFDEVLVRELARHARSGVELSLVMLDIDHFKAYNDNYGHVHGDICLQRIAQVIAKNAVRAADIAARYGGEEFACILPETDLQGAVAIAEKIRTGINHLVIPHDFSITADFITASFGVASVACTADMSASDIIGLADNMLYKAKDGGRNRVERDTFNYSQPSGVEENFIQLVWSDTFCSGNRLIDDQHRKLFRMSNQLLDAIESFSPNTVINERVTHLLDDIAKHFHDEEVILELANFPGRIEHAEEHAGLYQRGLEIARTFHENGQDLGDIIKFLVYEVVFRHMHQKDREFFPFIKTMHAESE